MTQSNGTTTSYWPPDPTDSPMVNAVPFLLTKPVNLAQLQHELIMATGEPDLQVGVVGPYPDGTMILWVTPPSVDPDTVNQVIADHVPESGWGVPQVEKDYQDVMTRLLADPEADLSDDDVRALVRGLAFRQLPLPTSG